MYEGLINDTFKNIVFTTLARAPFDIVYDNFKEAEYDKNFREDKPRYGLWGSFKKKEDFITNGEGDGGYLWENRYGTQWYPNGIYELEYKLPEDCKILVFNLSNCDFSELKEKYGDLETIISNFDAIIEVSGSFPYEIPSICITNKKTFENLKIEGAFYKKTVDDKRIEISKSLISNGLENIDKCGYLIKYLDNSLKNDYDICKKAINENIYAINYIGDNLKNDKDFIIDIIRNIKECKTMHYDNIYDFLPIKLKEDKDIIIEIIKKYKEIPNFIPEYFIDKEVALEALKTTSLNFNLLPYKLKKNMDILLFTIKMEEKENLEWNGNTYFQILENVDKQYLNDKDFCLKIIKRNGRFLKRFSKELQTDKEVVLEAVKNYGYALEYASDELRADKEIVLTAVKQNGDALYFASDELKNDKNLILELVKQNGYVLSYLNEDLLNNKEIVLEAVKQKGNTLQYVSDELRADKEIVLTAVKQNGNALYFASEELKKDKGVVLEAVKNNGKALQYVSDELRTDKEFLKEIIKDMELDKFIESRNYFKLFIDIHSKEITDILTKKFKEYEISDFYDLNKISENEKIISILSSFSNYNNENINTNIKLSLGPKKEVFIKEKVNQNKIELTV